MANPWRSPQACLPPTEIREDPMEISLREAQPPPAAACGRICYDAFKAIAGQHNFPARFSLGGVSKVMNARNAESQCVQQR